MMNLAEFEREFLAVLQSVEENAPLYDMGSDIQPESAQSLDSPIEISTFESLIEAIFTESIQDEEIEELVVSDNQSDSSILQEYVDALLQEASTGHFNSQPQNSQTIELQMDESLADLYDHSEHSSFDFHYQTDALLSVITDSYGSTPNENAYAEPAGEYNSPSVIPEDFAMYFGRGTASPFGSNLNLASLLPDETEDNLDINNILSDYSINDDIFFEASSSNGNDTNVASAATALPDGQSMLPDLPVINELI